MGIPLAISLFQLPDPVDITLHLVTGLLSSFLDNARDDITHLLGRYLFATADPSGATGRPLTSNPDLRRLTGGLMIAADTMATAVVVYASLRSMFEHQTLRARYTLRVMLPRFLVGIALIHSSLLTTQMFIDLNNALGHVAISLGSEMTPTNLPWSDVLRPDAVEHLRTTNDLFHSVFDVAVVVALVILVLAYVIRAALLNILIVVAPLAGLFTVLPDTRGYARTWSRLFLTTLFMQALQLIVLRVASVTALDHSGGLAQSLYGIATLYILLKVPGALNTAAHLETKAKTMSHNLERSLRRALHQTPVRRAAA